MIIRHTSKAKPALSHLPKVNSGEASGLPGFNTPEAITQWSVTCYEDEYNEIQVLIFLNEYLYTPIVIFVTKDFSTINFEKEFHRAIQDTWRIYGIPEDFINAYLSKNAGIACTKLSDRASIGKLTSLVRDFHYNGEAFNPYYPFQYYYANWYKHMLFKPSAGTQLEGRAKERYLFYSEWTAAKCVEAGIYHEPEFSSYELELRYLEADQVVLRTLEVPDFLSFEGLHKAMQAVFFWADCHIWDILVASPNGVDEPAPRRLIPVDPDASPIELPAISAQPEVDYAFDKTLSLKPLARIKPDGSDGLDWMQDGVSNYYPSMPLLDFFNDDDYAIYHYDYGVGHTVRIRIMRRFLKHDDRVICTYATGDARGEDDGSPLITMEGKINYSEDSPHAPSFELRVLALNEEISARTIKENGGPYSFVMSLIDSRLRAAYQSVQF